jgi:hypothetical protein
MTIEINSEKSEKTNRIAGWIVYAGYLLGVGQKTFF